MTVFSLKIIAIICMLLDHIGAVFPAFTPPLFRWIGRISFPIFAFLITEGCSHTKNMTKYMINMGIFALISEIPFDLAFNQSFYILRDYPLEINFFRSTNIFYTLFISIACIYTYEKLIQKENQYLTLIPLIFLPSIKIVNYFTNTFIVTLGIIVICILCIFIFIYILQNKKNSHEIKIRNRILSIIPITPFVILSSVLGADYGIPAIILIVFMYFGKKKMNRIIILIIGILYMYLFPLIIYPSYRNMINYMYLLFSFVPILLITFYNGKRGIFIKWVFYWIYPIHLSIIAFINIILVRPILNGF